MKKILFVSLLFSSYVFADILYVKNKRCILDDYYFNSGKFHYDYSSTGYHASTSKFKNKDLEYGYEYVDNKCQKLQILKITNMTYSDYKFMTALVGLLIGFSILIILIVVFMGAL